jgi:hypothetical protein
MPNLSPDEATEIRVLLDRLTNELRHTQRELAYVRRRRNASPYVVVVLILALGVSLATRSVGAQSSNRVVAPFTVVDANGKEMLFVGDPFGDGQIIVRAGRAAIGTSSNGNGFVQLQRSNDQRGILMGGPSSKYGLRIFDSTGDVELVSINEAAVGGGVLTANDKAGKTRMLMSGQGQLHAVDASGATRATMTADGAFSIRNKNGTTIARLGESPSANGMFQLANSGGDAVVEAGLVSTGAGVVRTYPNGGVVGGALGLPGTFIMGFVGSTKGQ